MARPLAIDPAIRRGSQAADHLVAAAALRQHGVVGRWQLLELGLSPGSVDRRVSGGRLHVVHQGVYAVGHRKLTREGWWMAGVLAYGPGALLSYRSAGALWDILRYSGVVEVSLAGAGRRSRPGLILHQPRALAPQDAAEVAGIPVTSVARTLLDLASTLNLRRLQRAIEEAEGGDLLDLRKVRDVCARNLSHPGRKPLAVLIALLRAPQHFTRSELERAFVELCKEYGIPPPAMNMIIEGHEVDASWEEHRLIVEIDTIAFHGTRAAFERDRVRDATLQLAGWRVVRITDTRIAHEPAAVAALIHALLGTT